MIPALKIMNDFYIYSYTVPGEDYPFYIGKGRRKRWHSHLLPHILKTKSHFYHKVKSLLKVGIQPQIEKIEENLTEDAAFEKEIYWIKFWGRIDLGTGCLCNHTNGGEGLSGWIVSNETRQKMSAAKQGFKWNNEHRQKISAANRGVPKSKEHRQKISVALQGSQRSQLTRQKISNTVRNNSNICGLKIGVESYNLNTNETLKVFNCLRDAEREGFDHGNISRCIHGRKKSYRGVGWRVHV
jgi:hypothetical protein